MIESEFQLDASVAVDPSLLLLEIEYLPILLPNKVKDIEDVETKLEDFTVEMVAFTTENASLSDETNIDAVRTNLFVPNAELKPLHFNIVSEIQMVANVSDCPIFEERELIPLEK
mmetsp:Transcript_5958/g.19249  ORF Transcript_5958/g.19249 Transcript_5958/m.19249 type:complete len:115 (+) Transcript_5958:6762-7106(+)